MCSKFQLQLCNEWWKFSRNLPPACIQLHYQMCTLSILTAIFPGEPGLAGFIATKDNGSGGDNWSYKTCKAPVRSSPTTNQQPSFYRWNAVPSPNQLWQSTLEFRETLLWGSFHKWVTKWHHSVSFQNIRKNPKCFVGTLIREIHWIFMKMASLFWCHLADFSFTTRQVLNTIVSYKRNEQVQQENLFKIKH